jgi:hypothetical protein
VSAVASVLCAGCAGRGLSKYGGWCEDCYKRGPDTPPELVRLARRARLYYGLTSEAARHLGVGRRYVSGVINLHRLNRSGRLGHRRVFATVAALVRDCEAACLALHQSFHLEGGRFIMRNARVKVSLDAPITAAVLACHRAGQTSFHAWADDALQLGRLLNDFEAAGRAWPGRVPVEYWPELQKCNSGCAGHVLILWRGGKPMLIFDNDAGLACMAALEEVFDDSELFGRLCAGARPVASLDLMAPCA